MDVVAEAARHALTGANGRLVLLGLCGAQGSGKSTLAAGLKARLEGEGVATAILSIDDLYKTRAAREGLARTVHPLLRTRGVPGTHDVALGLDVIAALERGEATWLPRFDKAADDRLPPTAWDKAEAGTRLLILEGWCVGARPQAAAALGAPVNALEREEDAEGIWRRYANMALAGPYQPLFARIDLMVLLAAPNFGVVQAWRSQQEQALRAVAGKEAPGVMSDAGVERFIQHYERLTRHILHEMPGRADLVIRLGEDRSMRGVEMRR
ncbi:kinase [Sphingobium sp. AN558]|uniref:kinase n=1 Tax=Sphingobium sp. AN558 TaxID=3133442 RepID=UPI0030BF6872